MAVPVKITPAGSLANKWVEDMQSGDEAKVEAGKTAWANLEPGVKRGWQTNADVMDVLTKFDLSVEPSAPAPGAGRKRRGKSRAKKTKKGTRKGRKGQTRRR